MTYLRRVPLLAAVLTTLGLASVAHASSPAGVWGRLDKVTFDPNMKVPVVRIDGVFMVANQQPDFPDYPGYSVPQYGYMLYNCALPKEQPMCLMQWTELQKAVGSDDICRGWGDNSQLNNGTVRPAMDPEQKPDAYPIALGVVQGFSPCAAIKAWQVENPPPDDPPPGTTSGTGDPGSTGELGSTGTPETTTAPPETTTAPGSTSGDPGSTSGTPATTDASTGGAGSGTGSDTATTTSAPTEGGAGSTSGGNNTTATATDTSGADDKGGCACDSAAPARPGLAALALLGVLGLRRRRA